MSDRPSETKPPTDNTDRSPVPDLPPEKPDRNEPTNATHVADAPGARPGQADVEGGARIADLPPELVEQQRGAVDSSGFRTTDRELNYVGVSEEEYDNLQRGDAPLGMSPEQYQELRSELETALKDDGLDDADVRLQGTAATFYSRNPRKEFFVDSGAIEAKANDLRADGKLISPEAERDAVVRYQESGYDDGPHPRDKVFDQDYAAFGDESLRSDYDIQISSDRLDARMREFQMANPQEDSVSDKGGHWRNQPVRDNCAAVRDWADRWSERTGRSVNLAGFAGSGPEGASAFRDDDWVVRANRSPEDLEEEQP